MPLESDRGADRRAIVPLGLQRHVDDHWAAWQSCGHTQHLRHRPSWQNRAWVMVPHERQRRPGQSLACGWCATGHHHG